MQLLTVLYPVTIAVSAIIAAGLALLLMLQGARDAAIMWVLGATRLRVRIVLCAQQIALCLVGLTLGLAVLTFIQQGFAGGPLLCAAIYLMSAAAGSALSSVMISNKMPLELLQVKE